MQNVAASQFVAFEFFALRLLFGLHGSEFIALLPRFLRQAVELFDIGAQAADEIGTQAREVGQVMQVARDLVGIFTIKQQFDRIGLVAHILLVELLCEQSLLRLDVVAGAPALLLQIVEFRLDVALFCGEIAQRAVRFRDGVFGIAQCVGGLCARALCGREAFLQGLNPIAQLRQFFLRRRRGGRRGAGTERREDQKRMRGFRQIRSAVCRSFRAVAAHPSF